MVSNIFALPWTIPEAWSHLVASLNVTLLSKFSFSLNSNPERDPSPTRLANVRYVPELKRPFTGRQTEQEMPPFKIEYNKYLHITST